MWLLKCNPQGDWTIAVNNGYDNKWRNKQIVKLRYLLTEKAGPYQSMLYTDGGPMKVKQRSSSGISDKIEFRLGLYFTC